MTTATFTSAARSFAALVHEIPAGAWGEPGLGEWDVRALVGHTSRSLTTVRSYLRTAADREDIATPQEYYVRVTPSALGIDPANVAERGRQAGRDLGDDPAPAVDELVSGVTSDLAAVDDPLIEVIGGLGIRLHTYLPTRIFELAVHGMDIARALDIPFRLPEAVLAEALDVAMRTAIATGHGQAVLLALTGRSALPSSFSVV
ncbi:MAG: maleylpyruvate isomerase family mycothiol-dependent enzyme [Mycobacterium sp.]